MLNIEWTESNQAKALQVVGIEVILTSGVNDNILVAAGEYSGF